MSKKIVLSNEVQENIIEFIKNTYQCKISDVEKEFGLKRGVIYNNIDKDFLNSILFQGQKDSTKEKLRKANTGKKQSSEATRKRLESTRKTLALRDPEVTKEIYRRAVQTKIEKFGTLEKYSEYQLQKSRETKLQRYGDPNYNNMKKNKETKLKNHGDPNYNNKEQIRETQEKLYGGFAFTDRAKYEKTMLEKYGVRHNWSSTDPKLNGRSTMYENAGSKELHYQKILQKGRNTRKQLYSDEFYSNSEQAQKTMLEKYGVPWYCMTEDCQKSSHSSGAEHKRTETKHKNNTFHYSKPEEEFYTFLVEKFGSSDIFREYQDPRYSSVSGTMYKCDFYIKSKDLFIELNLFPTHNLHPFDRNSEQDSKELDMLLSNPTVWNRTVVDVWSVRDPEKLHCAVRNNLNYMCFYPGDDYYDIIQRV